MDGSAKNSDIRLAIAYSTCHRVRLYQDRQWVRSGVGGCDCLNCWIYSLSMTGDRQWVRSGVGGCDCLNCWVYSLAMTDTDATAMFRKCVGLAKTIRCMHGKSIGLARTVYIHHI